MLVCHCRAVFEREIREAVRGGAVTKRAIGRACGAGNDCGGCEILLDEIIAQETTTCACSRDAAATALQAHAPTTHR